MNQDEPLYSTLVLFGKESARSVTSPPVFNDVVDQTVELLRTTRCKLKARGTVQGEKGKNLAPRQGVWSSALQDRWTETLSQSGGHFLAIEWFDQAWLGGPHPVAFASLHKHWGYGPEGYSERTKEGPENSLTIAIREDLVENAFERLEAAAKPLTEKIDCFYGSMESGVLWDRPFGRLRRDMIDIRWQTRTAVDYRNGKYRVEAMVPRLYRGNLLCHSQFTNPNLEQLSKLPGVAKIETWPSGLIFLQLLDQPEYGSRPPPAYADFIRFIPD
ncbi:MAG TPA: hypothetical protein VGI81_05015 [Tepidisphaeraceae bacterium]|jgi:hypothetical protein